MSATANSSFLLQQAKRREQFAEALVVLFFACACGVLMFAYSLKVTLFLVAIFLTASLVAFQVTLKYSYKVEDANSLEAKRTRYRITPLLITVLRQAKVADDVTQCLEEFLSDPSQEQTLELTKPDLLLILKRGLGAERTREVEAVVLKYTRFQIEDPKLEAPKAL